ncbi:hypothetical protein AF332_20685 [Sporosarcina globispora]|uniref:Uncharacterized protein n=1 Tax=Sporosarcina globispora TaxID=1459 RepID=A0A0M0GGJ7_SPOGL|nr:hypothetical protein [Sporosarcina globispora]KON88964.1 hypothetical protein AF332_20685 [Sporosarcina globispora]
MVIQPNMSSKAIVEIWGNAKDVFVKYNVPISEEALATTVETHILDSLLKDLNSIVGSSSATCIEGG